MAASILWLLLLLLCRFVRVYVSMDLSLVRYSIKAQKTLKLIHHFTFARHSLVLYLCYAGFVQFRVCQMQRFVWDICKESPEIFRLCIYGTVYAKRKIARTSTYVEHLALANKPCCTHSHTHTPICAHIFAENSSSETLPYEPPNVDEEERKDSPTYFNLFVWSKYIGIKANIQLYAAQYIQRCACVYAKLDNHTTFIQDHRTSWCLTQQQTQTIRKYPWQSCIVQSKHTWKGTNVHCVCMCGYTQIHLQRRDQQQCESFPRSSDNKTKLSRTRCFRMRKMCVLRLIFVRWQTNVARYQTRKRTLTKRTVPCYQCIQYRKSTIYVCVWISKTDFVQIFSRVLCSVSADRNLQTRMLHQRMCICFVLL